jgi:hypothetical protein
VKEAYRLQKITLEQKLKERKGKLSVFFIYTGKEIPGFDLVFDKMKKVLDKLCDIIDTGN